MNNRFYSYRTLLLSLLLVIASAATAFLYIEQLYFCLFFTGMLILALIYYLCHMQRSNFHMIERLVDSLRYKDFTLSFALNGKNKTERHLRANINEVVTDFRKQLAEHQERYKYYETLLDTVDTALLVVDRGVNIQWMNLSAEQNLCGHRIHSVEALNELNPNMVQLMDNLKPGEVKVVRFYKEELIQEMAVSMTEYAMPNNYFRLYTFKNLRSLLEENEMEAWQKLVRVLTHEMMNSVAPILSLSETLAERAEAGDEENPTDEMIVQGMKVIHRRSKGLLEFVDNYRKLSRLSSPELADVQVGHLLNDIRKLMQNKRVEYRYSIEDENFTLLIDRTQIEQVLINLLKNAEEACAEQPHPIVEIATDYQKDKKLFSIRITDNGCGILPDIQDKIFVPFFTTKHKGSGIGLSLCKQIMSLHGGAITVKSEEGVGSTFTLKFFCK